MIKIYSLFTNSKKNNGSLNLYILKLYCLIEINNLKSSYQMNVLRGPVEQTIST